METTNQRIQLTNLPVELLFLIFRQAHCLQTRLRIYSVLRLVCRALDRAGTQLAFESFTVTISPLTSSDSLETLHTIFENHAHCIRTLTIHNTISRKCNVEKQTISRNAQHIIRRGFLLCTQIRSLACLGSHGMFSSRSWISLRPPASLTSLTFTPNKSSTDLSYCLLAMRDSLRSLKIITWCSQNDNPSRFHLPSSLPHLTDLTLIGCDPPPPHMKKLFSRIITPSSPQNTTPAVPLRSLTVTLPGRSIPSILADIVSILATRQFGTHLRTLCINVPRDCDMEATIPTDLLRLCPNLVEFTYHCHRVWESVLRSLPSTLAVLELSPREHATSSSNIPLDEENLSPQFLALWLRDGPQRKRSAPGLRRVIVNVDTIDLFIMMRILKSELRFARTIRTAFFTCLDISLEGQTIEITPSYSSRLRLT